MTKSSVISTKNPLLRFDLVEIYTRYLERYLPPIFTADSTAFRKSKETEEMDLFRVNATTRTKAVTSRSHSTHNEEREVVAARKALPATKATFERTGVPVKRQSRCDIECPDSLPRFFLFSLSLSFVSFHSYIYIPLFFFFLSKMSCRRSRVTLVVNE